MFYLSCVVTTSILFFLGLRGMIIIQEPFDGADMLKLISVAFAGSMPTLIFVGKETTSRWKTIIVTSLHFVLTAGTVFGLLIFYEFIDATNTIFVAVVFLVIYITAYAVIEIRQKRLADKLNEKINAFHNAKNETHHE